MTSKWSGTGLTSGDAWIHFRLMVHILCEREWAVNLKKQPARGYATLIHPSNKNGNEIISRVLREIKLKALSENIMDLSVCGSIAPYNEILGGKLIASLITSQEVRDLYKKRYFRNWNYWWKCFIATA